MRVRIHRKSRTPLREQIYREFSDRIQSGILETGSRLPSVRELAEDLQVSLVTVVQAYRLLERHGLVKSIHGKGTFVQDKGHHPSRKTESSLESTYDWQMTVADFLPRATVWTHHSEVLAHVPYRMSTAALNPELAITALPFHAPAIPPNLPDILTSYGPVEGLSALRETMSFYFAEQGFAVHKEQIVVTNGVQQAIDLVARTFMGPGDVVAIEAPTYPGAIDVFRSRGANLVSIPMDEQGIRIDLLLKQCDRTPPKMIYTMPNFQNPTGIVMSEKRRRQLLDLAETYHILVIEDDSFSDCTFIGDPPPSIASMDQHGHVVYLKGFSKFFLAGCRIAAVVSSGSIRTRLIAAKSVTDLGSPPITQAYMNSFLTDPHRQQRTRKLVRAVQRKRDIALEVLEHVLPQRVSWTRPDGGYNIWITVPDTINTLPLLSTAHHRGVSFLPGMACYANETIHNQLRLSYAYLDDDALRQGVTLLATVLTESLSGQADNHLPMV